MAIVLIPFRKILTELSLMPKMARFGRQRPRRYLLPTTLLNAVFLEAQSSVSPLKLRFGISNFHPLFDDFFSKHIFSISCF